MAKILPSYFLQSEFKRLYGVLFPSLNQCGACGITKCVDCQKFDISCKNCKSRRCIVCVKFFCTLIFFYINTTEDQWNYICNFLHDVFRLDKTTRLHFKDVLTPISFSISDTLFITSKNREIVNKIRNDRGKRSIYFVLDHKKYKFYFAS